MTPTQWMWRFTKMVASHPRPPPPFAYPRQWTEETELVLAEHADGHRAALRAIVLGEIGPPPPPLDLEQALAEHLAGESERRLAAVASGTDSLAPA